MTAPLPENEALRLEALRRYNILDTAAEELFDQLTLLAARMCQTPIALISLVDKDRQWFKSRVGLGTAETPRAEAFCAHTILCRDLLVVGDALADERFATNPLVTGDPHIRFYAGVPLVTTEGYAIGTLSVLDHQPRRLNAEQTASLQTLAHQVVMLLELRRHSADLVRITQALMVEVEERARSEEQRTYEATHDGLTGLPNRYLFAEHLKHLVAHTKRRHDYQFALLFLDLDRFKAVNDSLGHMVADQLLVAVARRLEACLRPEDSFARFGGDEFTILIDDLKGVDDATRFAQRILQDLAAPFDIAGRKVLTTASIGIALSSHGCDRPEDCLRNADAAMYYAKAAGRSRYAVYDESMRARSVALLNTEADLRRAVASQQFQLYYQPIVSLSEGVLTGFEALIRWRHPLRGIVLPHEFIPVAEDGGVIVPISEWVLRTACGQAATWRRGRHSELRMAVNLSARLLGRRETPALVKAALDEAGLPPRALELEITETAATMNAEPGIAALRELQETGVGISIDDFGTGYSSLSQIKRFPVKTLKIDQSFVRDVTGSADDAAITTAIIAMGHKLHLRVIAEGVETNEQLDFLRRQGCDEVQGYLLGRPSPAEAFAQRLS